MASSSGGGNNNELVALEFKKELNSLTASLPPVSKEKINQIVRVALKEIRNYKHVVYYVENFIKNCTAEYKVPGLYVIDAIIRNCRSQSSIAKNQREVYTNRFSKNICKTFSHLYSKSSESDREKIARVLSLWQKYSIFDAEVIDRLNRISSAANIDSAINGSGGSRAKQSGSNPREAHNVKKFKRLQYVQEKLQKLPAGDPSIQRLTDEIQKLRSELLANSCPQPVRVDSKSRDPSLMTSPTGTRNEISKLLNFHDNDDDSYSDSELLVSQSPDTQSRSKRIKKVKEEIGPANLSSNSNGNNSSLNLTSSERLETSITNCAVWLQKEEIGVVADGEHRKKAINLPDLSQPPPPLSGSYLSNGNSTDPLLHNKHLQAESPKDKERDRSRRGLPNIRDKHICICSKTLWLGHLAKCTTEDYVIEELTELLSPSSSNDSDNRRARAANRLNKAAQNIIVDCQIIPPRGCAYIEFVDRRTASKCLERMKDGYRLEGNLIKVAWATSKGINKDRILKQYWNVEVGCAYVPWPELKPFVNFVNWAEGGLVDEESIPPEYFSIYKQQTRPNVSTTIDRNKNDGTYTEPQNIIAMSRESLNQADMDLETEPYESESINRPISAAVPTVYAPPPPPHHQIPIQALTDLQKQLLSNHLRHNQVQQQPGHVQFLHQHQFQQQQNAPLPQHFQSTHANPSPNHMPNHEPTTTPSPQIAQFNPPSIEQQIIKNHQFQQQQQQLLQHQPGIGQYVMHMPNLSSQHYAILQQQQHQQRSLRLPNTAQQQPPRDGFHNLHPPITHEQIPLFQQINQHQNQQQQQQQQRVNLQALQQQQPQHMIPIQTLAGQNHLIQQNPALIQFLQQQHQLQQQLQHQQLHHQQLQQQQQQQQQQVAMLGGLPLFNNHISTGKKASPPIGPPQSGMTDQKPVSLMDMSLPQPPILVGQMPTDGCEFHHSMTNNESDLKAEKDYDARYVAVNDYNGYDGHRYQNMNGKEEELKIENDDLKTDLNENQAIKYESNFA